MTLFDWMAITGLLAMAITAFLAGSQHGRRRGWKQCLRECVPESNLTHMPWDREAIAAHHAYMEAKKKVMEIRDRGKNAVKLNITSNQATFDPRDVMDYANVENTGPFTH